MAEYTLTLPREIDQRLDQIAAINNVSKAEAIVTAFALLSIAERRKQEGYSMGIIREIGEDEYEVISKVIGL